MTSTARIPATEITGLLGAVVKAMLRRKLGEVPESVGVMWNHPKVLRDMAGFGRKVERWDRLDPSLTTYANMAVAALVGCGMCLDLQYYMAHEHGLDEAKAREVPRWRESTVFSPLERLVMEYAEAASQTPPTVTDALSAALLAELGPAALIELTAKVGMMNLATRMNISLGLEAEGLSASCGLAPLATGSSTA